MGLVPPRSRLRSRVMLRSCAFCVPVLTRPGKTMISATITSWMTTNGTEPQ
ncbi:hypothetical protein D3C72_1407320 [compost metagenome]